MIVALLASEPNTEFWSNASYVALGAILGAILSLAVTLVHERIRERKRRYATRQVVKSELLELRGLLAQNVYILLFFQRVEDITLEGIAWIKKTLEEAGSPKGFGEIDDLEDLFLKSPEELRRFAKAVKGPGDFTFVRTLGLPFLRAHLEATAILETDLQRGLVGVLTHVDILNQQIEQCTKSYWRLLGSSLPDSERAMIDRNIHQLYAFIIQKSITLGDLIGTLDL